MTLAEKPHVFSVTEHIIPLIKIGVAHQSEHELQHPRDCKALWKNLEQLQSEEKLVNSTRPSISFRENARCGLGLSTILSWYFISSMLGFLMTVQATLEASMTSLDVFFCSRCQDEDRQIPQTQSVSKLCCSLIPFPRTLACARKGYYDLCG